MERTSKQKHAWMWPDKSRRCPGHLYYMVEEETVDVVACRRKGCHMNSTPQSKIALCVNPEGKNANSGNARNIKNANIREDNVVNVKNAGWHCGLYAGRKYDAKRPQNAATRPAAMKMSVCTGTAEANEKARKTYEDVIYKN